MAKRVRKMSEFDRYLKNEGASESIAAHSTDEILEIAGGSLPSGIEDGVAQIISAEFGVKDRNDKWCFKARALCKEPESHEGKKIRGKFTNFYEPLYDTPGRVAETVDDHISQVIQLFKRCGLDTEDIKTTEDVHSLCEILVSSDTHISFRTWKGTPTSQYPEPRVNEVWVGAIDYEDGELVDQGVTISDDDIEEQEDEEQEDEEGEESENPDWKPQVGEQYSIKPPGQKDFINVKITSVDYGNETVSFIHKRRRYTVPFDMIFDIDDTVRF